jgi:hypothetical protein
MVRAGLVDDRFKYKERVAVVAPTKIVVYVNPIGGITKYQVVFEGKTRTKPLTIGPATIEEIADRLRAEGLVYHTRLLNDILNAIIQGAIKKERAEIREEIEAPGFYLVGSRITPVRIEITPVSSQELREALELLNELAERFNHALDKFSTVVKWGLIAPFSFVYKQKGSWLPWLYLYGSSQTGKTTLGEIVLALWSLATEHMKSGANIDTVPRLGYVLSQSTFPIVINEPGSAILKDEIIEVIKSATESITARGKHVKGSYIEIPSLAPLIFTSNKVLPRDDALLRRFIVLRFTWGEKITREKADEFTRLVKPKLRKLGAIGRFIAWRVVEKGLEEDWLSFAESLLRDAYQYANLDVPEWILLRPVSDDDLGGDIREIVRGFIVKRINDEFTRFVGKITVETPDRIDIRNRDDAKFEDRVKIVITNKLIPWLIGKDDEVLITTAFIEELRNIIGDVGGLKSLAELLGWEYKLLTFREEGRVQGFRVIATKIDNFIAFLVPEPI